MGQSTDAIIAYGIQIDEESETHNLLDDLRNERWKELSEAEKEFNGVTIVSHCSGDYPMYIIGFEVQRAYRGDGKVIEACDLTVKDRYKRSIGEFCTRFGIKFNLDECKFWLVSDWS